MTPLNPPPLTGSVLLQVHHQTDGFDCGITPLNDYLKRFALQNNQNSSARTYVVLRADRVVGYYTLAFGGVEPSQVPSRIKQGLGRYPVPVLLIARLAICLSERGQGLGKALLKNALLKAVHASEIAGLRAVLVHAKNEEAETFYKKFGFVASPIDEFHLYLLMKDLKQTLL